MGQMKAAKKVINASPVEKMLRHFENYNFIKKINTKGIQYGFLMENLKEYVRKEWIQSNVVASDWPTFLFSQNSKENYVANWEEIRNLVGTSSFSVVEMFYLNDENKEAQEALTDPMNAESVVRSQFKKQSGTILWSHCFCNSENASEIFHKKQRERKNWWRKFSAFPGRFKTSTINNKEQDKSVICEVQAEFPWGLETVETIKYFPDFSASNSQFVELLNSGRKKKLPHVVFNEAVLENITFTFMCDSYEKLSTESDRDVLMLDRRLAPYKVAIAGSGSSSDVSKSLEEVSLLLAKQIRRLGISVLFLPDVCTTAIQKQVLRNDALGVPYTLLFDDRTVREGILALRSRDTTLQEGSHVSLITEYLEKIFK